LRYVRCGGPGFERRRAGKGFVYLDLQGKAIRDRETLRRIRSLALPPAWEQVWISPLPNGHLQATGVDARGRRQYRYHAQYRLIRNHTKFNRMLDFAKALPAIRARVESDLKQPSLTREKVVATVVALLERTLIRVGNEEYARENSSFGLTTLRATAGSLRVPRLDLPLGAALRVRIRARDVMIALEPPAGLSALNVLPGVVAEIGGGEGAIVDIRLDCAGDALIARLTRRSVKRLGLAPGRPVYAVIKSIAFDHHAFAGTAPASSGADAETRHG